MATSSWKLSGSCYLSRHACAQLTTALSCPVPPHQVLPRAAVQAPLEPDPYLHMRAPAK